jgi:hypothetical protein
MNTKRYSIVFLALALITALAYAAFSSSLARAEAHGLPGSWIVTVQPDPTTGVPSFINYTTITTDGTMINSSNSGGVGPGVWEKINNDEYQTTFNELFMEGDQQRIGRVRGTVRVSQDKESFSGQFTTEVFDQDSNLLFSISGTVTGIRMHVEPLQ